MTKELSIEDANVTSLYPNSWNTNVVSPENEERIESSLKRFGMFRPIVVRQVEGTTGYEILGGEHRWTVAKRLGYSTVPVVNLGYIDDQKAKEIGLVDNGRYGEDDTLALAELLKELGDVSELQTFMPYTDDELSNIFASTSIALEELDLDENDEELPPLLPTEKAIQTHQIMRFKVPVEDSDYVQRLIEQTMKAQGYTEDDSLMNAGHALVYLLRNVK